MNSFSRCCVIIGLLVGGVWEVRATSNLPEHLVSFWSKPASLDLSCLEGHDPTFPPKSMLSFCPSESIPILPYLSGRSKTLFQGQPMSFWHSLSRNLDEEIAEIPSDTIDGAGSSKSKGQPQGSYKLNRLGQENKLNKKEKRKLYECTTDDIQVNTPDERDQLCGTVLALTEDTVVVTWSVRQSPNILKGKMFDIKLKELGPEFEISSSSEERPNNASRTALLSNGSYVVVWEDANDEIKGQIMSGESQAGAQIEIASADPGTLYIPDVCSLPDGGFWVIWSDFYSDTDSGNIIGKRFDNQGKSEGAEFSVLVDSNFSSPKCAVFKSGKVLVVWSVLEEGLEFYKVLAQVFDSSGNSIVEQFQVSPATDANHLSPYVTALNDGRVVIAWTRINADGLEPEVLAQIYDSKVNPIGEAFAVNTLSFSFGVAAGIAKLYDGGFLISWEAYDIDLGSFFIYARRYDEKGIASDPEFPLALNRSSVSFAMSLQASITALSGLGPAILKNQLMAISKSLSGAFTTRIQSERTALVKLVFLMKSPILTLVSRKEGKKPSGLVLLVCG